VKDFPTQKEPQIIVAYVTVILFLFIKIIPGILFSNLRKEAGKC
jgi:hypothetical protein